MTSGQKMRRIRAVLDTEARHLDYAARDKLVRSWMAWHLRDLLASIDAGYLYPDEHNPNLGATPLGEVLKRDEKGQATVVRTRGGATLYRAVVGERKAWVTIPTDEE